MFEANHDLRAVSTTHFTEAAHPFRHSLLAEIHLAPDDPIVPMVLGVVGAAISGYLTVILNAKATDGTHQFFMRYLRKIVAAACPTHSASTALDCRGPRLKASGRA